MLFDARLNHIRTAAKLRPNARGKPRRSEAEGTNRVAVGVGLTKQLGEIWC